MKLQVSTALQLFLKTKKLDKVGRGINNDSETLGLGGEYLVHYKPLRKTAQQTRNQEC